MSLYIWVVAGVWQDDTAWVLWQDQWDKGDEYALNILAVHCLKCPAKFVNNIYVRAGISCTLAGPAVLRRGGRSCFPETQFLLKESRLFKHCLSASMKI